MDRRQLLANIKSARIRKDPQLDNLIRQLHQLDAKQRGREDSSSHADARRAGRVAGPPPSPATGILTQDPPKKICWICPSCTFENHIERPGCELCTAERPAQPAQDYQEECRIFGDDISAQRLRLTVVLNHGRDKPKKKEQYRFATNTTVADLKEKFLNEMGIPMEFQKYVIAGDVFSDDTTLDTTGVNDGDEITLLIRQPKNLAPKKEADQPPPLPPPEPVGWVCSLCTWLNKPSRPGCEMCTAPRPEDYVMPDSTMLSDEDRQMMEQAALEEKNFSEFQLHEEEEANKLRQKNYHQLQMRDTVDLIPNTEEFECPVCFTPIPPGEGVVLRECLHASCKDCLADGIKFNQNPDVQCPHLDGCEALLQEREVKALVGAELYATHLKRSVQRAEQQEENSYHCKATDCVGWCIYEDEVNEYDCPVCKNINCLLCKAIHKDQNCQEYQDELKLKAQNDEDAKATQQAMDDMITQGEAMRCPKCKVIVQKKSGCDWMCCLMCKVEICWATKGPRWGPKGNGDTSGGCKCRVGGKRCTPKCGNCH